MLATHLIWYVYCSVGVQLGTHSMFLCGAQHCWSWHVIQSTWESDDKHWKAPWATKAPSKMNIVLWRFLIIVFPLDSLLCSRNIPVDPTCIFCGRQEIIEHSLLFCHFAQEVWWELKSKFQIHLCRKDFRSPKKWLFAALHRFSPEQSTVLAVTMWHIWEARNAAHNGVTSISMLAAMCGLGKKRLIYSC